MRFRNRKSKGMLCHEAIRYTLSIGGSQKDCATAGTMVSKLVRSMNTDRNTLRCVKMLMKDLINPMGCQQ